MSSIMPPRETLVGTSKTQKLIHDVGVYIQLSGNTLQYFDNHVTDCQGLITESYQFIGIKAFESST